MQKPHNVFLVGPMGAGKTTIGRQLASALGFTFEDSDQVIQQRTGVDIPTIFEFEGEEGFRQRESQVIEDLTQGQDLVLATGGGVVLRPDNRRHLAARGCVVYLLCTPEQQYERTARDRNRPLLQTADPLQRLRDLMQERDPLYRQVADLVVSTERRTAAAVVRDIRRRLEREHIP
jgi:shikimate kinase